MPAVLRRRLPRLYSSHGAVAEKSSRGSLPAESSSSFVSSFPDEHQTWEPVITRIERPSTASDDLTSFDSQSRGSISPPVEEVGCPDNYETESGLRWNRVAPAFNLLRNAGYEAQRPQADGRLVRSLYVSAVMYLLDALPSDLTPDETVMLRHRLPESLRDTVTSSPNSQQPQAQTTPGVEVDRLPRSYLHRLLASMIVQCFIFIRFVLPYLQLFLHKAYEYERSHRLTERFIASTLDVAEGLGRSSASIGSAVLKLNEGKLGIAVGNFASWWIEGIAGGVYDGVGEGMMQAGLVKTGLEL
ncbi:Uncharacterized protein PECH_006557 [Penicillium ucsense]|uniref:Uncharacterized protein n=1 Tax=Penicillium ucsense TaxID=2839758 RepID=A0A8J8W3V1_9EURO|nr:Uncharacterized protein PECM_006027 [Penicillium ucsense]KAF7735552.1 Uncharacterized protein PECH_006557 [Penicillium ucsense]